MTDIWTDRLSEYLDGDLLPADRAALEAHLATCRDCACTLEELRLVTSRAAALETRAPAHELWPASELWPGIAARLEPKGTPLPFRARMARRVSFTLPQLVAASLALIVASGGAVWVLQHGGRATDVPPVSATAVIPSDPAVVPAALADPRYDEAIADLEQALADGRANLDPGTVTILEANLAAIDHAIDQCRQALASDPANAYLHNHLADARQRKLALLRRATELAGPKG